MTLLILLKSRFLPFMNCKSQHKVKIALLRTDGPIQLFVQIQRDEDLLISSNLQSFLRNHKE